ncbi:hypothetical protein [Saliphagus infecundisoli]|uniref:Uncharacterized protein n=1 Tax=Saliphagus infecundisoli TaxID=1849069 RepID=A0ABD5QLA8_9EURY|nr:hypothetical protein [Saliphagus infecundisoli]
MTFSDSWSSDRFNTLDYLENHLPEPVTLTESIGELETTLPLYDQLTETESTDG